ncbi:hypothetical protein DPMN_044867 [Dreissena polymorpha]|uniref:Uncharacterized protein n=1 Tax=Dreissena polymorpha TaxID=45954 RepID=A0A9D4D4X9_DREPO|nr:hypothetical protein DPMN_044867 [Dreissena polymorpha]
MVAEADAYSHAACRPRGRPRVVNGAMHGRDKRKFQGSMARTDGQTDGGDNRNKPVNSQLTLPTKHKLYVSGRGNIYTNCIRNNKTLRYESSTPYSGKQRCSSQRNQAPCNRYPTINKCNSRK